MNSEPCLQPHSFVTIEHIESELKNSLANSNHPDIRAHFQTQYAKMKKLRNFSLSKRRILHEWMKYCIAFNYIEIAKIILADEHFEMFQNGDELISRVKFCSSPELKMLCDSWAITKGCGEAYRTKMEFICPPVIIFTKNLENPNNALDLPSRVHKRSFNQTDFLDYQRIQHKADIHRQHPFEKQGESSVNDQNDLDKDGEIDEELCRILLGASIENDQKEPSDDGDDIMPRTKKKCF